jgi:hypothetical protein
MAAAESHVFGVKWMAHFLTRLSQIWGKIGSLNIQSKPASGTTVYLFIVAESGKRGTGHRA